MYNIRVKLYLGQNECCSLGDSTSESSGQLLQRDRGQSQYICDSGSEYGVHANIYLHKGFLLVPQGADVKIKGFRAFLDMSRYKDWVHKISYWKYLTLWRPVLPVFPEHRVPHPWSLPWSPFRRCWRSAVRAAHDLILKEVDGKGSQQVTIRSWQNLCSKVNVLCIYLFI